MQTTSRFLMPTLLVALLLSPLARVQAQDAQQKPVMVISVAGVDKLLKDIRYLTRAAGAPQLGGLVALMAGEWIQGLDGEKPAGAVIDMSSGAPSGLVFIPVSDFDTVLSNIENGIAEPEDVGDGVYKLRFDDDVYFMERDGWVFISNSVESLDTAPADPVKVLGPLAKYDLGIQFNLQAIPAELRDMAISEMKRGFEAAVNQEQDDEARQFMEQFGERGVDNIITFIKEADQLSIGWGVDSKAAKTHIDVNVTAVEGTTLAEQLAAASEVDTNFGGFVIPGASAYLNLNSKLHEEDIKQTKAMLDVARKEALKSIDEDDDLPNDEAKNTAKAIVDSLLNVVTQTIEAGKIDGGATLFAAPNNLRFVAGGFVADGKALEGNLKQLVELAKQAEDVPEVELTFNAAEHDGVSLHTLLVPVPEDEEAARRVLGDKLEVVVGTGGNSLYIAFGDDAAGLIKQVIDGSKNPPADLLPMSLVVSIGPIIEFAASIEDDDTLSFVAEAAKEWAGKDHVRMTATPIDRGLSYSFEVEEGVLQLIGKATRGNDDPF